jgi:hypothetical protein
MPRTKQHSKEYEFVVEPLEKWFTNQRTQWSLTPPKKQPGSTGWDIQARRKKGNQDLLIEAKFFNRSISSFAGLVTAPIVRRSESFMKKKEHGWCANICWAIGYTDDNIYQILLDYLSRQLLFWEHYSKDFGMKYVFFIKDKKVSKILFIKLLNIAKNYLEETERMIKLNKRIQARKLMSKYLP